MTVISSGLTVSTGQTSAGLIVGYGGVLTVLAGGSVSDTELLQEQEIVSGSDYDVTIFGGIQLIYGSAVDGRTIEGSQIVESRRRRQGTTISSGGTQFDYGSATDAFVANGSQVVEAGRVASGTTVGGLVGVYAGVRTVYGSALSTTVSSGGTETVESGGTASGTTILSGGALEVSSGGTLAGTLLFAGSGGDLRIDGTSLSILGGLAVSGFVAGDTIDLAGVAFDSSGSANLQAGNVLQIIENGATYDLQLDPSQNFVGRSFHLAKDTSGGTAITQSTALAPGSSLTISAGQTASSLVVDSGAVLTVLAGGSASGTTISSGGTRRPEARSWHRPGVEPHPPRRRG